MKRDKEKDIDLERLSLLAEVASLYYEQHLTQSEIAKRIYTSRSRVSRILTRAREKGVVEVMIHFPGERVYEVEHQFKRRFGNIDVRIVSSRGRSYKEILRGIGLLTAQYLDETLRDGMVLGITWGRTMYHCSKALQPTQKKDITVVQIIGAAGTESPAIDAPDLVRQIASVYGGRYKYLHAPLFVESPIARETFLKEPSIAEVLSVARKSDIVITGIGSLHPEMSNYLVTGHLSDSVIKELRSQGGVGHICAHFYDIDGKIMDVDLNKKVIGLDMEDINAVKKVVGVGGGETKTKAILGAVRGGHLNVLITDDVTARIVMELDSERD